MGSSRRVLAIIGYIVFLSTSILFVGFSDFNLIPIIIKKGIIQFNVFLFSFIVFFNISEYFIQKIDIWEKVDKEELFREDRIFLSFTGFFQSLLFVLISSYEFSNPLYSITIKLNIIIITFVFFIYRGYAHIKDDSKKRWRSMQVFFFAIFLEFPAVIISIPQTFFPINIVGENITAALFFPITVVGTSLYEALRSQFSRRYDI